MQSSRSSGRVFQPGAASPAAGQAQHLWRLHLPQGRGTNFAAESLGRQEASSAGTHEGTVRYRLGRQTVEQG